MFGCVGLKNINFSIIKDLRLIKNCGDITNKDFYSLTNLISIGSDFMENCTSLTYIDLSHLSNLQEIGNNFLSKHDPDLTIMCTEKQKEILSVSGFNFNKVKFIKPNIKIIKLSN